MVILVNEAIFEDTADVVIIILIALFCHRGYIIIILSSSLASLKLAIINFNDLVVGVME